MQPPQLAASGDRRRPKQLDPGANAPHKRQAI